jgi:hypothetical protein
MLCLPEPLLRARGMRMALDDWPKGATLGSAWRLEAICAGVSALAADRPPPVDATSTGVLSLVAGVGDLFLASAVDDLCPVVGADDLPPASAWATSSPPLWGADPPMTMM